MRAQHAWMRQAVGLIRSMDGRRPIRLALRSRAIGTGSTTSTLILEEGTADAIRDSCTAIPLSVDRWRDGRVGRHPVSPRARCCAIADAASLAQAGPQPAASPDARSRCSSSARIRRRIRPPASIRPIGAPLARKGIQLTPVLSPAALTAERLAYYDAIIIYGNHTDAHARPGEGARSTSSRAARASSRCTRRPRCSPGPSATPRSSAPQAPASGHAAASSPPRSSSRRTRRCRACSRSRRGTKPSPSRSRTPTDRTVLMERVDGTGRTPWTWVRNQGKGRVFYTAYGHDQRTWNNPGFQTLVEQRGRLERARAGARRRSSS